MHRILGIDFFGGTSREAVEEITRSGGLLVAPAAPSMIALCRDEDYRRALLAADLAIADSGFMVLLWRFFTGERVPRISGLEHVKRLLEHESVWQPGAVLWVVPTESSREKLEEFLALRSEDRGQGTQPAGATTAVSSPDQKRGRDSARPSIPQSAIRNSPSPASASSVASFQPHLSSDLRPLPSAYVAPRYSRPVEDEALLTLVRQSRPRHIVIAVGGGIQDKLGLYLLEHLDYRPAIHCLGAALGFLTGDQVRIPDWADKYYVGWFFRSLAQPRVFIPRFWSARRLPVLIAKYRDRLPPVEK